MRQNLVLLGLIILTIPAQSLFLTSEPKIVLARVPQGAQWFYLNSTFPILNFSLMDFTPGQSFVGQYNIQVICQLFLGEYNPPCEVVVRNLWNPWDPPRIKSTNDSTHSEYQYIFNRPTISDPDFMIGLELNSQELLIPSVEGWINLYVESEGTWGSPLIIIILFVPFVILVTLILLIVRKKYFRSE